MKSLRLLTAALVFAAQIPATLAQFSDIQKESLDYLYKHHYVDGYSDGTFGPAKEINRAEFVTLLLRAENVPLTKTQNCFPDVKAGVWYHDYVCTAKELGHVKGYDDGLFHPEQMINKAEAAKMIVNILAIPQESDDEKHVFSDVPSGTWFHPFVNALDEKYYVDWTTKFNPALPMTREAVAEILFRNLLSQKLYEPLFAQTIFAVRPSDPKQISEQESLGIAARDFFRAANIIEGLTLEALQAEQNKVQETYEQKKVIYTLPGTDYEKWNYKVMLEEGGFTYGVLGFYDPDQELQTNWRDYYASWAVLKFETKTGKLLAYDFFTRYVDHGYYPVPNIVSVNGDRLTLQVGQSGSDPAIMTKEGEELIFDLKDFR